MSRYTPEKISLRHELWRLWKEELERPLIEMASMLLFFGGVVAICLLLDASK